MRIEGAIAARARELVKKQAQTGPGHSEETAYRALCERLPVLLRTAGLARTVTFLAAKKSAAEYAAVLAHLQEQLREVVGIYTKGHSLNLPEWATTGGRKSSDYRHVSTLAFRVAYWHKRLAQALLRKKDEK